MSVHSNPAKPALSAQRLAQSLNDDRAMVTVISRIRDHRDRTRTWSSDAIAAARMNARDHSEASLIASAAIVIEAIDRVIGLELFDVQIRAGWIMAMGGIAELPTGEGKTLSAIFPAYVHAVRGGVHIVTTNGYLARRDYEMLRDVYRTLGLTTGLVTDQSDDREAAAAYNADVTFAASHTFGFDLMRDSLSKQAQRQSAGPPANTPAKQSEDAQRDPRIGFHGDPLLGNRFLRQLRGQPASPRRQRRLNAAIIDEIDDVLLDDATSPLILSSATGQTRPPNGSQGSDDDKAVLSLANEVAAVLNPALHFQPDRYGRSVLSENGLDMIYRDFVAPATMKRTWHEYVQNAWLARNHYQRDVHYIVRDAKIQLIDGSTGRLFTDRTWSRGLQQAVETCEGIEVTPEAVTLARITKQSYFRRYAFLAGMTGTAQGCQTEFGDVYGLPVIPVGTRLPSQRVVMPMRCHRSRDDKYAAIADEAHQIAGQGRAVLIGTLSIHESRAISALLQALAIDHQILNGVQDADEATVIAAAGSAGQVTVATSLAGRGTDIQLDATVRAHGGLHVIVGQMHSLARVDRQLIGRGARCGDPGSARYFVSADDALFVDHAPWIGRAIHRRCDCGETTAGVAIENAIAQVQQRRQRAMSLQRADALQIENTRQDVHRTHSARQTTNRRGVIVSTGSTSPPSQFQSPTECWAL